MPLIYKITSPSNKIYIGQTWDWIKRKSVYRRNACKGQIKLYNSLVKYGFINHILEIIHELPEDIDQILSIIMRINTRFFSEVIDDNDETYFKHLIALIESVDELSSMEITKTPYSYNFRIATSLPKYNEMLLQEILKFHNLFNIQINMSKSIKSSATIVFNIKL